MIQKALAVYLFRRRSSRKKLLEETFNNISKLNINRDNLKGVIFEYLHVISL